jgi:hypothetical protein
VCVESGHYSIPNPLEGDLRFDYFVVGESEVLLAVSLEAEVQCMDSQQTYLFRLPKLSRLRMEISVFHNFA